MKNSTIYFAGFRMLFQMKTREYQPGSDTSDLGKFVSFVPALSIIWIHTPKHSLSNRRNIFCFMRLRSQLFCYLYCLFLNTDEYSGLALWFCVLLETALGFGLFKYTLLRQSPGQLMCWQVDDLRRSSLARCDPASSPV